MAMRDYAEGEPVRRIPRYISNLADVAVTDLSKSFVEDLTNYILALSPNEDEPIIMEQMREETYKIHLSDQPGFVSALDAFNRRVEKAAKEAAKEAAIAAEKAAAKAAQEAYQEKLEIARGMLQEGLSIAVVAKLTKLPLEEVQKL